MRGGLGVLMAALLGWTSAVANADDLRRHQVKVDKRERTYHVFDPAPAGAATARPLFILLHGAGDDATDMRDHGFEAFARAKNFVIAYPEGFRQVWADGRYGKVGQRRAKKADDSAFLNKMISQLAAGGQVNANAVYAVGVGNGGFMAMRLACDGTVAGVATQLAGMAIAHRENCQTAPALPVLMINASGDETVPIDGGPIGDDPTRGTVLSAGNASRYWAQKAGCVGENAITERWPDNDPADGTTVLRLRWGDCPLPPLDTRPKAQGGHDPQLPEGMTGSTRRVPPVLAFRVNGGGRVWHGEKPAERWVDPSTLNRTDGPTPNRDFYAAELIVAFFGF